MATETARPKQEVQTQTRDADEFAAVLKQSFKPRTERAATELNNAVKTLVEQALADTSLIKSDVLDTIGEMIAQLDKKLSAQMNEIMHSPEFQQIEGAWRGLADDDQPRRADRPWRIFSLGHPGTVRGGQKPAGSV